MFADWNKVREKPACSLRRILVRKEEKKFPKMLPSTTTTTVSFSKLHILFPAYCSGLFLELKNRSGPTESRFLVVKKRSSSYQLKSPFRCPCIPSTDSPGRGSGYRTPEPGRVPKLWGGSGPQTDYGHICPWSCLTPGKGEDEYGRG